MHSEIEKLNRTQGQDTVENANRTAKPNTIVEPTFENLERAKALILSDDVVGMPTETVYGLAANAFSDRAIQKVYELKGRPQDNPLIVHVDKGYDLERLIELPKKASFLALLEKLTPEAITFICKNKRTVSPLVSAGLNTLAIRIPKHTVTQQFLKIVDLPIAAPSANLSTHTSPVTAEHVYADFGDKLPLILDGGRCQYGLESTVCDITGDLPIILRQGLVSAEEIAEICGDCKSLVGQKNQTELKLRSPGTRYKHYAPYCKTKLFTYAQKAELVQFAEELQKKAVKFSILLEDKIAKEFAEFSVLNLGATVADMAKNLYLQLREAEKNTDYLLVVLPQEQKSLKNSERELLLTVQNRLKKACGVLE